MTEYVEINQEIQQIKEDMLKMQAKSNTARSPYESEELGELFTALAKAQMEMEIAKNDSVNPFFKSTYADLASVVKASRPFLAKNGLSVIQRILPNGNGMVYLFTRLCHASGQWMESRMEIKPPKPDIQTVGSHITYLKRYNYAAMVGVVSSDEDDDGETAMREPRRESADHSNDKITKAQLQVLSQELEDHEEILESLFTGFKISKLADLPAKSYTTCISRIREIKRAKEN